MYEFGQVYCSTCRKSFSSKDCGGVLSNRCPCCCAMVRRHARSLYADMKADKPRY